MIRLGIVDFDSSHAVEFTRRFNHGGLDPDQIVEGARVVLGFPGTSSHFPSRIDDFTRQVISCDVGLVEYPEAMIGEIDAVLVLSLEGNSHLNRVRPFLEAGIPAFVDKPFACSRRDAEEMLRLAAAHKVPLLSASAMRYSADVLDFLHHADNFGPIHGVVSFGPAKRLQGNPGLFHYGIHPTELLLAVMGPGCQEVVNTCTQGAEIVTGRWQDGRLGTMRGLHAGATRYGIIAFCEQAVVPVNVSTRFAYRNLCREIVRTVESGRSSLSAEAMLETVSFIEAAATSEKTGGQPALLQHS